MGSSGGFREDFCQDFQDATDFPAYNDTVYSDIPLTVIVLTLPDRPFLYKKRCGYSDTPLTGTLFSRPEGVTVSEEVCIELDPWPL